MARSHFTPRFVVGLLLCAAALGPAPVAAAAVAPTDTLALVNGDPITAADFDKLIMQAHDQFKRGDRSVDSGEELLEKRIGDYLIIQDAMAAGYDQEPEFVAKMEEAHRKYAVGVYVRDQVTLPETAPADSVRAWFERYYWRIQLRRISVRTREEAEALWTEVAGGGDMDALAREHSLDTKKLQGGLYNLLYWVDLENTMRDLVRDLEEGQLSAIVPYNDSFTFVRVEQRLPVHEETFARHEEEISRDVLAQVRQRTWDAFVRAEVAKVDLNEDIGGLMTIAADSAVVLDGAFLKEQPAFVIEIAGGKGVTGTALRRAISHGFMQETTKPFAVHMAAARRDLTNDLVLGELAFRSGYDENPEVLELLDADWERELIGAYLRDHVTAKIVFKREDYEAYYDKYKERFRGPDEVRLDLMILDTQEEAEDAAARLAEGADFGYVFKQFNPGQEIALGQSRFIKIPELSEPFRNALEDMSPGQSSPAIAMPMGWMVFKLDARRQGAVPPPEALDMDIRRALYKATFDELLAEHLAVLAEGSEIKRFPARIEAYLSPDGEGE